MSFIDSKIHIHEKSINKTNVDLKDVFKTILRHKYIIALFAIIFAIGASYFAYTTPNVYSSFATIELQEDTNKFTSEDALKQAFAQDKDIHSITAAQVFGVLESEVDAEMRRKAKAINIK